MTIAKLFARIGLKTDAAKAARFEHQIKNIKKGLFVAATAAVGFSIAIKKITDESFAAAAALKQFEAETGASTQELQKWQAIAEQTNNAAQDVTSSIKAIVANQEKIRLGQGDISGYQLLGIDPRQDPFKILEELRTKTQGLTRGMKKNVLSQIGVSAGLIRSLELTNEQFDKMAARAFIIPQSAINIMDGARSSIKEVGQAVNWLKAMIATALAPNIKKMNKIIVEWIRNNKDGIIKTTKTIFKWITKYTKAIINVSKMINEIIKNTIGWKAAMIGMIAVVGILNSALLLSPIGLITAGIILLVAVLDDLYRYSQGKESLFGILMKKFPEFEKGLQGFFSGFKDFLKIIGFMETDKFELDKILEQWGAWGDILNGVIDSLKSIQDLYSGKTFDEFFTKTKFGEALTNFITGRYKGVKLSPGVQENIKRTQETRTIKNINHINIDVQTNGDAKETANLIIEKFQKEINGADTQRSRNE